MYETGCIGVQPEIVSHTNKVHVNLKVEFSGKKEWLKVRLIIFFVFNRSYTLQHNTVVLQIHMHGHMVLHK